MNNLGIPHALSEADIYNGYFIPQGMAPAYTVAILHRHYCHHECLVNSQSLAVIGLSLSRAMTRNEAKYARPEEFCPEHTLRAQTE